MYVLDMVQADDLKVARMLLELAKLEKGENIIKETYNGVRPHGCCWLQCEQRPLAPFLPPPSPPPLLGLLLRSCPRPSLVGAVLKDSRWHCLGAPGSDRLQRGRQPGRPGAEAGARVHHPRDPLFLLCDRTRRGERAPQGHPRPR